MIDQLQKELNIPRPSSCMRDDHVHMKGVNLDVMEESHVESGNEKRAYLHMLEKSCEEDNIDQAPIERKTILTNALVARCCWKASGGKMEGETFLEECLSLKEGMAKMKESYMNLLSDKYQLRMVAKMYQCALKKEA